jgi:hypothetical protein
MIIIEQVFHTLHPIKVMFGTLCVAQFLLESTIEETAIDWLKDMGYKYASASETAFDGIVQISANMFVCISHIHN